VVVVVVVDELVDVELTATSLVVVDAGVVVGVQLTETSVTAKAARSIWNLFISLQGSAAYAERRYAITFHKYFQLKIQKLHFLKII
jgi:hypothetical protein